MAVNHKLGEAFYKNQVGLVTPEYDAGVYTGRAAALGATNDLVIGDGTKWVTWFDFATGTHSKEQAIKTFNNITLNSILVSDIEPTTGDMTAFDLEPNKLAEVGINGTASGITMTVAGDDEYWTLAETTGATCYDARSIATRTITGDVTSVRINQQSIGVQTTALILDANGVPTAYNSVANTAKVYSDSIINTGFRPNIARYSIDETVSGELQDFGSEVSNPKFTGNSGNICSIVDNLDGTYTLTSNNNAVSDANRMMLIDPYLNAPQLDTFNLELVSGISMIDNINDGTNWLGSPSDVNNIEFYNVNLSPTRRVEVNINSDDSGVPSVFLLSNVSVKELTTKTQRTERRVLTHTDAHLFPDEYAGTISAQSSAVGTPIVDGYNISDDGSGTSSGLIVDLNTNYTDAQPIILSFDAVVNSGTPILRQYFNGTQWVNFDLIPIVNGTNRVSLTVRSGTDTVFFRYSENTAFNYDMTDIAINPVGEQNKYYIGVDGGAMVEQTVVPPLPDPATTINLGDTAVIGYADTIETRLADFKVNSDIVVP